MRELENTFRIKGILVSIPKNEEIVTKTGRVAKSVRAVVRTEDGSEHRVDFFTFKFKSDNGKDGTEVSKIYNDYKIFDTAVTLEKANEGETPTVVNITGSLRINDYLDNSGNMVSTITLNGRFVDARENNNKQIATFSCHTQIDSITDEMKNGVLTGNVTVKGNIIDTRTDTETKTVVPFALNPITFTVDKSIADGFKSVGYYDSCMTQVNGTIVNKVVETVQKKAFGEETIREITRGYMIEGADDPKSIYDYDLTDDDLMTLRAKRKQHLTEVQSGVTTSSTSPRSGFGSNATTANQSAASAKPNPFLR